MSETKYIADLHLLDPTSLDWRGYLNLTLDDYPEYLKDRWNKFTDKDDLVIIIGDLGYYSQYTMDIIRSLNGRKVLVIGNHDSSWLPHLQNTDIFQGIYWYILHNGIYIKHIPELSSEIKCNYFIHGHHHCYSSYNMRNSLIQYANDVHRYNCAADLIKHKPCTIQELSMYKEELLEQYKEQGILEV